MAVQEKGQSTRKEKCWCKPENIGDRISDLTPIISQH